MIMKRTIPLLALVLAAGCSVPRTGVRIGDNTLEQFEAGVTTEAWLVAIIGEPTSWSIVEGVEDTRVYRYELVERKGGLLSFFTGDELSTSVVYFIISEGVVTRFWTDREVDRTLMGQAVEEVGGVKASP
jgi:hypothetical protein